MKVFKKIAAAVSMAAMCCAMIVPTTANAQPCIQHTYKKVYVGTNVIAAQYDEHTITTTVDEVSTTVTLTCNVRLERRHYVYECMLCGQTNGETYEDVEVHMGGSCPK